MSTTTPDTTTVAPDPSVAVPDPTGLFTVNRSQDGAQVRAELSLGEAQSECAILNAQARQQVALTAPTHDEYGNMVRPSAPIYGSMFHGQVSRYEVRSASGLVI